MNGILLCGGLGSRLYPTTLGTSKQLLPVYDKPVIYYPLSTLMEAGLQNILIISSPQDLPGIRRLLGNGSQFGLNLAYAEQPEPKGIADAFRIARPLVGDKKVCLILGDNIFSGHNLRGLFGEVKTSGANIFSYVVNDPERYGVIEFKDGVPIRIHEKPKLPPSDYAVTGLYFYDEQVWDIAQNLKPSARGELEITDVNQEYMNRGACNVIHFGSGFAWLDVGTPDSLLEASNYIKTIQHRQGIQIACLEAIAYEKGWITQDAYKDAIQKFQKTDYGRFMQKKYYMLTNSVIV